MPRKKKTTSSTDHVHKYRRVNIAGFGKPKQLVFRCMLPGCSHYKRPEFFKGSLCICWRCGNPFEITREAGLYMAKPHCSNCIKRRSGPSDVDIDNLLGGDSLDSFMDSLRKEIK